MPSTVVSASDGWNGKNKLPSQALIGMARRHMKDYRLPDGYVDMPAPDTGVIVLIILYIMDKEPNICRTKLEYYILLLERLCFDQKGVTLFNWHLKNGRIQNFKTFTDFMTLRNLIFPRGNHFAVLSAGKTLLNQKVAFLVGISGILNGIITDWKGAKVPEMTSVLFNAKQISIDFKSSSDSFSSDKRIAQ